MTLKKIIIRESHFDSPLFCSGDVVCLEEFVEKRPPRQFRYDHRSFGVKCQFLESQPENLDFLKLITKRSLRPVGGWRLIILNVQLSGTNKRMSAPELNPMTLPQKYAQFEKI
jgi:hypothetical protein